MAELDPETKARIEAEERFKAEVKAKIQEEAIAEKEAHKRKLGAAAFDSIFGSDVFKPESEKPKNLSSQGSGCLAGIGVFATIALPFPLHLLFQ